jgi:ubiquinone/menaquinone biosynthesis C-methylase UbiE
MSDGIDFDAAASRIEAAYMTTDVVEQRCHVQRALRPRPGEALLDVGSGPGLLVRELAATVGETGRVCGIDQSEGMVTMARQRCAGLPQVEIEVADASDLPYPDASFDAAVSTQVYEYVADMPAALHELRRVLRPGARVAILDTDYDSLVVATDDETRLSRILEAWDEHFVHADLPRKLSPLLTDAGFRVRESAVIPIFNTEYHANAFSYHLTTMMAAFAVGRAGPPSRPAPGPTSSSASAARDATSTA